MAAKDPGGRITQKDRKPRAPINPDIRSAHPQELIVGPSQLKKQWGEKIPCRGAKPSQPDGAPKPLASGIAGASEPAGAAITADDSCQADN